MTLRHKTRPREIDAAAAIALPLAGQACQAQGAAIVADAAHHGWALAYALAWLSVAGGSSVMPPWVRHQFPEAGALIRRLRDTACADPACEWCREQHDAQKELSRWFGFPEFRPEPADDDGRPLPQSVVEAAMRGEHALAQREIGAWVLDEAHCLSKWGPVIRPDYRYVGRFIREKAGDRPIPPVLCLTATAKPDVVVDILAHFKSRVGIELRRFNGGASRTNLDFCVVPTTPAEKLSHVDQILAADLPADAPGGAIVYCATRRQTEAVADFLRQRDWTVACFHARLPPETKKNVQRTFIEGGLRVIVATNAFGMGIDKPDVRLVDAATIGLWLAAKPVGQANAQWWDTLREALGEYALEVGNAELPLDHLLEWLAEWGWEARRRQSGLLLLTAHKAKGLEFDHVAVLDGQWRRGVASGGSGASEDADAPR